MQTDDNYTRIDKKKAFLSTWTGKAAVGTASIALIGGGYYYLQPQKASSPSFTPKLQASFNAKKTFKDQTNLNGETDESAPSADEDPAPDTDRRAAVCGADDSGTDVWANVVHAETDSSSTDLVIENDSYRLIVDPWATAGSSSIQGRVQVRNSDGSWGNVCDDSFNDANARVFCRSLGLPTEGAFNIQSYGNHESGSNDFAMDDV